MGVILSLIKLGKGLSIKICGQKFVLFVNSLNLSLGNLTVLLQSWQTSFHLVLLPAPSHSLLFSS